MEQTVSDDLYNMRTSYTKTLEDVTQHFLKIISDEKKMSFHFKIDTERQLRATRVQPSWFLIDGIKLYVRVACHTTDSHFDDEFLFFLIKIFPENSLWSKDFSRELFLYELKMQKDVLPKIKTLMQSKIGPELYCQSGYFRIFFLEDLRSQGYSVKPFHTGLSFNDCIQTIQLMAKLHAASVALHEKVTIIGRKSVRLHVFL